MHSLSCTSLTSITIPNGVTNIGGWAFQGCTSLITITIPNSVSNIGDGAFWGCSSLTNVTIPDSVTNIGTNAFAYCTSLTAIIVDTNNPAYMSVDGVLFNKGQTRLMQYPGAKAGGYTISNSVTSIAGHAFIGCSSLTSVTIPNSVTNIGSFAFAYCARLPSITIPNGVTSIGECTFIGCTSLTNVAIPNSVISIGNSAFNYCTNLASLTIPNGVTNIGDWAFIGCSRLTSITIPNGVTTIGDWAFFYCTSLTSVTIGTNVTTIGIGPFASCTSLTEITVDAPNSSFSSVHGVLFDDSQTTLVQYPGGKTGSDYTIPSSVTCVRDWAFQGCSSLTSVTIPSSVTSVGDYTFDGCTSLTHVAIPNSVTNIGTCAFADCARLTAIIVDPGNPAYISLAGVLLNESQTRLIQYPGAKAGGYTIPNSVTSIVAGAFSYCAGLTSVTIPSGVTSLGNMAFHYCSSLKGVYFNGNAPSLGRPQVFEGATNATVYYLLGTTGWGTTYGGRPTALWLPQVQTSENSFGVRTNQFGFNIAWASGMTVVVEASTNVANPTWTPVGTNTLTDGWSYFSDPQWTNYPSRFYRLRSP